MAHQRIRTRRDEPCGRLRGDDRLWIPMRVRPQPERQPRDHAEAADGLKQQIDRRLNGRNARRDDEQEHERKRQDVLPAIERRAPWRRHRRGKDVLEWVTLVPPRGECKNRDAERRTAEHVERPVHAKHDAGETDECNDRDGGHVDRVLHPPSDHAVEEVAGHEIERRRGGGVAARETGTHTGRPRASHANFAEALERRHRDHHHDPHPPAPQELPRQQHREEHRERHEDGDGAESREASEQGRIRDGTGQRLVRAALEGGHVGQQDDRGGGGEHGARGQKNPRPPSSVAHARS